MGRLWLGVVGIRGGGLEVMIFLDILAGGRWWNG